MPEYTGSLLSFLLAPEQPDATTVEEQVAAIGEALPDGLEVLTPSAAEDKDVIVCTQAVADEFGLSNLSSLFEASSNITLGGPPEFETRTPFGLAGFRDLYGAEFEGFVPLTVGRCLGRPQRRRRSTAATCSRRCRRSPPRGSSRSRTTSMSRTTRQCCRSCAARLSVRS